MAKDCDWLICLGVAVCGFFIGVLAVMVYRQCLRKKKGNTENFNKDGIATSCLGCNCKYTACMADPSTTQAYCTQQLKQCKASCMSNCGCTE
jgi:hypothetical protein